MSDVSSLVRYGTRVEESGSDFFKTAYAAVCKGDPDRLERDRDSLMGCLVQIANDYTLDLSLGIGRDAAFTVFGATVSLGLAEASKENPSIAIERLRKNPLDRFVQIGLVLHAELRERATKVLRRAVLLCENGSLYGLLDPADESEIRDIRRKEMFFPERATFKQAQARLDEAEALLVLAGHLPLEYVLMYGEYYTQFQAKAYARKDRETPNPLGSVLFLVLRSFMLKGMTTKHLTLPVLGGWMPIFHTRNTNFLRDNLLVDAAWIRDFISETFFDPEAVALMIPKAVKAMHTLFSTRIEVSHDRAGCKAFPALKIPAQEQVMTQLTQRLLQEFQQAVRVYFREAKEVAITMSDLTTFWYPRVLLVVGERFDPKEDVHEGGKLFLMGEDDAAAHVVHLPTLLKVPPEKLHEYTKKAAEWPEDLRKRFMDGYDWRTFLDNVTDEALTRWLGGLVEQFGPTILQKMSHRRLTLAFWFKAWVDGSPALREAILQYFHEERFRRPPTVRTLLEVMDHSFMAGEDVRLFAFVLDRVMREIEGEHLTGVSSEGLRGVFTTLLRSPEALRLFWARVPSKMREASRARLTRDQQQTLDSILAQP